MKTIRLVSALFNVAFLIPVSLCLGQELLFTGVKATDEGAIRLSWQSETGAIYRIEYTDSLTEGAGWVTLYDHYPSHGSNTFWLDTGNYVYEPAILHPKNLPMRFYRIAYEETDALTSPGVLIDSPTNQSTVSGDLTITVTAHTVSNGWPFRPATASDRRTGTACKTRG